MRLVLISDIHGNKVALDAVLSELAHEQIDMIVSLGDVALGGPQPRECLQSLRTIDSIRVMGNTDQDLLRPKAGIPEWIAEIARWNRDQLADEDCEFIATFRPVVPISLGEGVDLLCYHGSPRSALEHIRIATAADSLSEMLSGHHATVYAGGHSHVQMLRRHNESVVINPGSVGFAWERRSGQDFAVDWAEYAVLTVHGGRVSVDFRRTPYDFAKLAQVTKASGMPHGERWLSNWTVGIR